MVSQSNGAVGQCFDVLLPYVRPYQSQRTNCFTNEFDSLLTRNNKNVFEGIKWQSKRLNDQSSGFCSSLKIIPRANLDSITTSALRNSAPNG